MFTKIKRKQQAKRNLKTIQKNPSEFKGIVDEMARVKVTSHTWEQLLKDLYEYVYVQVFLNQGKLENLLVEIKHHESSSVYYGGSYWDVHTISIEFDSFVYKLRYSFSKRLDSGYVSRYYVWLQGDGLWSAQVYTKGKEPLPLLKEKQELKKGFRFADDVPVKVQERVNQIFAYMCEQKEKAVQTQQAQMMRIEQKEVLANQKRKELLENF